MPAISRKGDSLSTGHICVGTTTLDTPGQSTRIGDSADAGAMTSGSSNVFSG
jgi:hypothetical protein